MLRGVLVGRIDWSMCTTVHSFTLSSLQEKYQVHSQPDRARALEDLTEHFFDCNLENHYSHSDTHYGILLFLLCLADSPVNADYVRRADTPTRAGKE